MNTLETMRLDKWLWCARFYKTRSLATEEISKGRVTVNGQLAKPARDLRCGDTVALRQGPVARQLYEETPDSIAGREKAAELRRLAPEPAATLQEGRPTKRDRRAIDRVSDRAPSWGTRWSASLDDE